MEQEKVVLGTPKGILHTLLDLGQAMLEYGAEVNRVEDTIVRMGKAYGAKRMHVFVITSSIVVTMLAKGGEEITLTRRITKPAGKHFSKMEQLNALSRSCCENPIPAKQLRRKIREIEKQPINFYRYLLGCGVAAGSFCVFFGGTLLDGVIAILFALFICMFEKYMQEFCTNLVVYYLICSFTVGVGICISADLWTVLHADKIMIGDIMLLIPGLAMTNAVRDMLVGDTISGIMRMAESLLWAGALACGFMAAIWLF